MAYQQNNNSGALFKNDRKQFEKQPDYKGNCIVNGVEMQISAWIRKNQDGTKTFMSLAFEPPYQQAQAPQNPQYAPQAPGYPQAPQAPQAPAPQYAPQAPAPQPQYAPQAPVAPVPQATTSGRPVAGDDDLPF